MTAIIAIDPGTSNTGLVYMDERQIYTCRTITHRDGVFKDAITKTGRKSREIDQYKLRARCRAIANCIRDFCLMNPHDAIVIEGFQGWAHGGRANSNTPQTPYLCGYLMRELEGENVIIQTSTEALRNIDKQALCSSYPGGGGCTNDHVRAAACHGIYFFRRNSK